MIIYKHEIQRISLVPRPHPAFRRLQYGLQAMESWVGPGYEATNESYLRQA